MPHPLSKALSISRTLPPNFLLPVLLLAISISITACSFTFTKETKPVIQQEFDEVTGANVTSLTQPLIFYREHPWLSSNTRDYVYLGPIRVSRTGEHEYILWLGIWSTIDRQGRPSESVRDAFQTIYLVADGEPMELEANAWSGIELGMESTVYSTPVNSSLNAFYAVSQDQIKKLAQANNILIYSSDHAPSGSEYKLWKEGSQSIAEFTDNVPDE